MITHQVATDERQDQEGGSNVVDVVLVSPKKAAPMPGGTTEETWSAADGMPEVPVKDLALESPELAAEEPVVIMTEAGKRETRLVVWTRIVNHPRVCHVYDVRYRASVF